MQVSFIIIIIDMFILKAVYRVRICLVKAMAIAQDEFYLLLDI